jgi:hypothetical protein
VIDLTDPAQWNDPKVHMQANIEHAPALFAGMVEQFESPNELDNFGNPKWVDNERLLVPAIFRAIKGSASTRRTPFVGPSLTRDASYCRLGDLSASLDYGNVHNYLFGWAPERIEPTRTICDGRSDWTAPLDVILKSEHAVSGPTNPVQMTESGFCTGTDGGLFQVDRYTQLAYVPRLFLAAHALGYTRTYYFQLADDERFDGKQFGNCGLLDDAAAPKPAFNGLQAFIAALSARGSAAGGSLTYKLSQGSSTLFQRGDGSYAIVVWNPAQLYCFPQVGATESGSCPPGGEGPIKVDPLPATLSFAAPHKVALTTLSSTTGLPTTRTLGTIRVAALSVTPVIQILTVSR